MNFYALSGLLNGLAATGLGVFVLLKAPRDPRHRAYAYYCLSLSVWSYFYFAWQVAASEPMALTFVRLLMVGAILIPPTYLHHMLTFLGLVDRSRALLRASYIVAAFFLLSNLTPLFVEKVGPVLSFSFWPRPGVLFHFYLIWFVGSVSYTTYLTAAAWRRTSGTYRNQLAYLTIGSILGYVGGATTFPLWYGIEILPIGTILVTLYAGLVAYAMIRYRFMDIVFVFNKWVAYILLLGCVLLVVSVMVMISHRATIYALPPLLVSILVFTAGLRIIFASPRAPLNFAFAFVCAVVSIWLFGIFMVLTTDTAAEAERWSRVTYVGVIFIPLAMYHCTNTLWRPNGNRFGMWVVMVASGVFLGGLWSDQLISGSYLYAWGRYPKAAPLLWLFILYALTVVAWSLSQLHQAYQIQVGTVAQKAQRFKYIWWGFAVGSLSAIDFIPSYGDATYPMGFLFVALWIGTVTYGILRHGFLDVTLPVSRPSGGVALQFLTLIAAYFSILMLIWGFTGRKEHLLSASLLGFVFIFNQMMGNLQQRLERAVGKAMFPERHDASDALNDFSTSMRSILDLTALTKRTVASLSEVLGIQKISIFLVDEEKDEYVLSAAYGFEKTQLQAVTIASKELLPQYLQKRGQAILKDELEQRGGTLGVFSKRIIIMLENLEAVLCLPLQNQGRLIGFINLGPKMNHSMYTQEDLENLSILAASAASAFANATFHQKEKNAQRREKHEERAHAFETIAGGFAHEIRNPLVSINTFLQLVPFRKDDPEFMEVFRKVVMNDSARIERLSGEVLGFARLHEPQRQEENLNDVVTSSLRAIEDRAQNQSVTLVTELGQDLPPVWIDSQQILQVLGNLIINALDAMEAQKGGQLTTRTRRLVKADGVWVQFEITDSGCGMPPDTLEKIFVPFFTTKHESKEREGTGLGLPICQRIIVAHGGYIEVKSEMGKSTTFSVNLPVRQSPTILQATA